MSTKHLLTPDGKTRCGASVWESGANVTSNLDSVSCGDGCLAVYPPPFGYALPEDVALAVMEAAKPRDVMLRFPLGGGDLMTVLDYRPVQGPLQQGALA